MSPYVAGALSYRSRRLSNRNGCRCEGQYRGSRQFLRSAVTLLGKEQSERVLGTSYQPFQAHNLDDPAITRTLIVRILLREIVRASKTGTELLDARTDFLNGA
jgi:hypothetical protein